MGTVLRCTDCGDNRLSLTTPAQAPMAISSSGPATLPDKAQYSLFPISLLSCRQSPTLPEACPPNRDLIY